MSVKEGIDAWADRKYKRHCSCEWMDAVKCAKWKHLTGHTCPCGCHKNEATAKTLAQMDALVLEAREGEKKAVNELSSLRAQLAQAQGELAEVTKDRLICIANAKREALLACDLRASQDLIIERCAKAVEQKWPNAAKQLREHCGNDPDSAVSGEDFGELKRDLAAAREERDALAVALREVDHLLEQVEWADPVAEAEADNLRMNTRDNAAAILRARDEAKIAQGRAEGLTAFANHIRDTWGQAYPIEVWPEPPAGTVDPAVRSACSASMGRHMAAKIEEEARQMADAEEAGTHAS